MIEAIIERESPETFRNMNQSEMETAIEIAKANVTMLQSNNCK